MLWRDEDADDSWIDETLVLDALEEVFAPKLVDDEEGLLETEVRQLQLRVDETDDCECVDLLDEVDEPLIIVHLVQYISENDAAVDETDERDIAIETIVTERRLQLVEADDERLVTPELLYVLELELDEL